VLIAMCKSYDFFVARWRELCDQWRTHSVLSVMSENADDGSMAGNRIDQSERPLQVVPLRALLVLGT
jgi:hypothetical protein